MRELLVIADPVTADVFRLGGMDVWTVGESDSTRELLRDAVSQNYGVVLVTESVARGIEDDIRDAQSVGGPVVVVIPAVGSVGTAGRESLSKLSQAVLGFSAKA